MTRTLLDDRHADFLLFDVFEADSLCALPHFADHTREGFELLLQTVRKFAREAVFPTYKPMDESPASYEDGRIICHPAMRDLYPHLIELGLINAAWSAESGGAQLPLCVLMTAQSYISAANGSAAGFMWLTGGAAHLIEAFGDETLRTTYMQKMVDGEWTGTMALTEPQAGSSLGDLTTSARPTDVGHYLMKGAKIFISGGDNDFTENIVHLALARIDGAPPGPKGISLFVVPKKRVDGGTLVDNDVAIAGTFHKLGYRGIPSVALNFGERDDCHGYLLGAPGQGLGCMFQMMNEARISVGAQAAATASAAYLDSLEYARNRPQGRTVGVKRDAPQVNIIEHADVRRMLLRQKAIVEGALALTIKTALLHDLHRHATDAVTAERSGLLLELLTPITKTFPSEYGFESNVLAVQILGGAGYTSDYLPESWLRDQKLNSIHEGTTGIQSLDLLGRKVLRDGGRALTALAEEIAQAIGTARALGLTTQADVLAAAVGVVRDVTASVAARAMSGDTEGALRHSADYLDMLGVVVVGWLWLAQASVAKSQPATDGTAEFYAGKLRAADYWFNTELPRVAVLGQLIGSGETTFAEMTDAMF